MKNEWKALPIIKNNNGTVKHIYCEGSRHHVVSYSTNGMECSEPKCEINRRKK